MSRFLLNRDKIFFPEGLEVEYEGEKFKIYRFIDLAGIVASIKNVNRLDEKEEDELDNIIAEKLPISLSTNFKIKDYIGVEEDFKIMLDNLIFEKYGYGYYTCQEKEIKKEEIAEINLENLNEEILNKFKNSSTENKPILFFNDDRTHTTLSHPYQIKIWQEKNIDGKVNLIRKINSEYKILEIL